MESLKSLVLPTFAMVAVGLLALSATENETAKAEQPEKPSKAEKMLWLCINDEKPCISEENDGCEDCPEDVVEKPYNLHYMMEVVGQAAKGMRDDIRAENWAGVEAKADVMLYVAEKVPSFEPPSNAKDTEKYANYAAQFIRDTESMKRFAAEGDAKGAKGAYRVLSRTCTACHQLYRE